jgi:lysyl-tRNA synthetase class 2
VTITATPPSAVAAAPNRRPVARRMPKLPYLVSRLFFLAAFILVVQALLPGIFWWGDVVDLYSTLFIPIDGSSVGAAAFLVILGGALARRKRAGWVISVALLGVVVAADLLLVLGSVVLVFTGKIDIATVPTLARFGFNLAAAGSLLCVLVAYRGEFSARRQPGSARKALLTLAVGLAATVAFGMLLVTLFPGGLAGRRGRLFWIVRRIGLSMFGEDAGAVVGSPVTSPPSWINTAVGLAVGLALFAALIALMRSQRRAALMSADDEPRVRALVELSPEDSLAYFATRRDKSVVFAASGQAAITYRVDLGVCLASSDPIGPPDHWAGAITAWQDLVDTYGWTPAVLGASEAGATAYARAG